MARILKIVVFISCSILINACCKEAIPPNTSLISFENLTTTNQLPYTLPTVSNFATPAQTKELFLYNTNEPDLVFRSIGVEDINSSNTKLWVQILNEDIRVFADVQIDSFYADSSLFGGVPILEIHNRDMGLNFFEMDTAQLALPFSPNQFDTYRPRLFDQTVATVHVKFDERLNNDSIRYNIERGVLKRVNQGYVGFKNIATGDLFFVELEGRYILKSIQVRKD